MANELMSVKDLEAKSIFPIFNYFSMFKEKYKDIMLTYDEWKSLWWADPENESENCYIFSVANEWLQNLITNILSLFKEKILII